MFLVCGLVALSTAHAAIDAMQFRDRAQEQRYHKLAGELRCLVCQNQSLADSNADLARDLRGEVLRLMNEGKSDKEITAYLVARYGDFVRYRPPLNTSTALLWAGPAILLMLAIFGLTQVIRARKAAPVATVTEADSRRLQALLDDKESES
jgi:cytochrome c-type biogenesis protein CcmH